MGLETVNENGNARLNQLNTANPTGTDNKNQGDDHIRNIKKVIKDQFSGISGDSGSGAVTATAAELNKLDGCTATTSELNILDGVTATATELNKMDGCTATTSELNILDGVTATATELNKMDGCTATTSELNLMDGCTATTSELNKMDGCTATTAELNILDNCTATAAELNLMDGCTATTTELNYVDGVTSAIQTQLNAKQATLTAGTNIDISSSTIHSSGCPDVVAIGTSNANGGTAINSGYNIPVSLEIVDKTGEASVNSSLGVYLPAGTYYYDCNALLRNTSGGDDVGKGTLQLYNDGGTAIGTPCSQYMGERSGTNFNVVGVLTTTGDYFRLRATSNETSSRLRYSAVNDTTSRIGSVLRFWRSNR
jgi:hypothetical protein